MTILYRTWPPGSPCNGVSHASVLGQGLLDLQVSKYARSHAHADCWWAAFLTLGFVQAPPSCILAAASPIVRLASCLVHLHECPA